MRSSISKTVRMPRKSLGHIGALLHLIRKPHLHRFRREAGVIVAGLVAQFAEHDSGPWDAPAGTLNLAIKSKSPVKTESGLSENSYFSICGLGKTTAPGSSAPPGVHVSFSGIK